MAEAQAKIRKKDWIRFQVPDKRVLEGFVQEVSPDGTKILVGKGPDSPENQWHVLAEIKILRKQAFGAPA